MVCTYMGEEKKPNLWEPLLRGNDFPSASKASQLFPKSQGSQGPHFLWMYRRLFSGPKWNRVVEVTCIKHQGAHFSPLQATTYLLKWQLALTCREPFYFNTVTQQEAQSIIKVCVELHFNLGHLGLQNNMVTLRFIFVLLFMKRDSLYFPQLVK